MFSVFINIDYNKRGQTCCLVAGAQIQTSCIFERNVTNGVPLAKIYLVDGFPCLSSAFSLLMHKCLPCAFLHTYKCLVRSFHMIINCLVLAGY